MKTFSDALGRVEDAIAALILAAVLGVVTYELSVRSLFGRSNLWTDELSRVLLIALVYFAAIGVTRDGGHVRVELMIDRLAPRYRAIADKLSDVLCLVFALSATWLGIGYVRESIRFGLSFAHSNLPFPVWVPHLIVPVCFALISLRLILRIAGVSKPVHTGSTEI